MNAPAAVRADKAAAKVDWCTPPEIVDLLHRFSRPGLDPCSNPGSIVRADVEWTDAQGVRTFEFGWGGRGLVYCNPPYGKGIDLWIEKMIREADAGVEIIGMVPANCGSGWFKHLRATASDILFWNPRPNFIDPATGKPAPNGNTQDVCSPYWGSRVYRFRNIFGPQGWLLSGAACT